MVLPRHSDSTGELWHTYVCATKEAALKSLNDGYGITELTYESPYEESAWSTYRNPKDHTQTAAVSLKRVVA